MENLVEHQEEITQVIEEKLLEAFYAHYEPAIDVTDSDECKSTKDLISEMSSIEEVRSCEINRLMESNGFKLYYNGSYFGWLIKEK